MYLFVCFCKILKILSITSKYHAFSIYFRDTDCQIIEVLHIFLNFIPKGSRSNLKN